jgi:hypothetical protein
LKLFNIFSHSLTQERERVGCGGSVMERLCRLCWLLPIGLVAHFVSGGEGGGDGPGYLAGTQEKKHYVIYTHLITFCAWDSEFFYSIFSLEWKQGLRNVIRQLSRYTCVPLDGQVFQLWMFSINQVLHHSQAKLL